MSSFTSFDDLHFGGLAEKRIAHCSLCQDEVEVLRDECTACGNRINQTSEGNNTYTVGSTTSPFGVQVDDSLSIMKILRDYKRRMCVEYMSSFQTWVCTFLWKHCLRIRVSRKNLFDKLPKFTIENSIEEHTELRSDSFTIEG